LTDYASLEQNGAERIRAALHHRLQRLYNRSRDIRILELIDRSGSGESLGVGKLEYIRIGEGRPGLIPQRLKDHLIELLCRYRGYRIESASADAGPAQLRMRIKIGEEGLIACAH